MNEEEFEKLEDLISEGKRFQEDQDFEILKLKRGRLAVLLAMHSNKNGWAETPAAQKYEILKLHNGSVAYWLAFHSDENGWGKTKAAQDMKVLSLYYDGGVASELAYHCDMNGWGNTPITHNIELLRKNFGIVTHLLENSKEWCEWATKHTEIWDLLTNFEGMCEMCPLRVIDALLEKKYIDEKNDLYKNWLEKETHKDAIIDVIFRLDPMIKDFEYLLKIDKEIKDNFGNLLKPLKRLSKILNKKRDDLEKDS